MKLADLSGKARRAKLLEAVNGTLRTISTPIRTSELVKRVVSFLDIEEGSTYVAKELQRIGDHPLRRETGETFVKYGRSMPRYEWLPNHKTPSADPEMEWRRARQRAIEAGQPDPGPWVAPDADIDAWTVHPEAVEDVAAADAAFLEED